MRLGDENEVLVKGPDLLEGYWHDDVATADSSTVRAGWSRATSANGSAMVPGGTRSLKLVDRQKDVLVTAGGKNVSPAQVETCLRASPYVSEAAVFGEGRKYLVALVEIDGETVAEWARARGLTHTGYASLVAPPRGDAPHRGRGGAREPARSPAPSR